MTGLHERHKEDSRQARLQPCSQYSADKQHLGGSSCITSIVRLIYSPDFAPTLDLSWDTVAVVQWSLVEELSAVLCMNLPPCRHLIGRALPGVTTTTSNTRQQSQWQSQLTSGSHVRTRDMHESKSPLVFSGTITTISAGYSENRPKSKGRLMSMGSKGKTASEASNASLTELSTLGSLVEVNAMEYRPHAALAGGSQQLDVEIDRSELGMTEVLVDTNWMPAQDERYARRTGLDLYGEV